MPIHLTSDGPVATITIDNGRLSILTPTLHRALFDALQQFLTDPSLHVAVLTGAAGASFCAGDDIKTALPRLSPQQALDAHLFPHAHETSIGLTRPGWEQDVMRLRRAKPIVGAVDGYCLGQGLIYLLLLTDLRIATPAAEFGFPEIAYGMAGAGGMTRLGRQVPHAVAMEMLLLGERIGAARAAEVGLVNRVVAADALMAQAHQWAKRIAAHPPAAVALELDVYRRAMDMTAEHAMDHAAALFRFQSAASEAPSPLEAHRS
jgi:enoyl-CoA hydratase/carnithine racemase